MTLFCPNCKKLIFPDPKRDVLVCRQCGFEQPKDDVKIDVVRSGIKEDHGLKIIEGDIETLPTTSIECPKCTHDKAKWFMRQTRAADEATTRFYICTKCGHRWREY